MSDAIEKSTMRKIFWRLVPLLFIAELFNYIDRFNLGVAALRMNHDLGFSPAIFGFGASVFFVGYMLTGVPSNLMLHKVGARKWLGSILIVWGLVATFTAFIWNPYSLYSTRFLLGLIEAGFLPGAGLYVTYWFPAGYRARAVAGYCVAGSASAVVGAPFSALIMTVFNGSLGLHSWQWMFILEGIPPVILGIAFLVLLTDRPANAAWLNPEQRHWLQERLTQEQAVQESHGAFRYVDILTDLRVWSLAAMLGCALVGIYGMYVWLPQIINSLGHFSLIEVGMLSAVPSILGVIGTIAASRSSDRTGDRKFHLGGLYLTGGLALGASAFAHSPVIAYLLLCVVGLCINSGFPLYWSLNTTLMTGVAAAGSIAFVNTVAQLGGVIGPWMIGFVKTRTDSFAMGLLTMAGFLVLAALIAFTLRVAPSPRSSSAWRRPSATSN
ncbi:MFS transporter [Paraburkholderia fungorum]|jgi:MFS transporter, ACS family, tartrate transporter|uniref:MFS transporter n=1 Tax=Paraburkholderia fungorum TaxID=134537 RepID=UPI0038BA7A25